MEETKRKTLQALEKHCGYTPENISRVRFASFSFLIHQLTPNKHRVVSRGLSRRLAVPAKAGDPPPAFFLNVSKVMYCLFKMTRTSIFVLNDTTLIIII